MKTLIHGGDVVAYAAGGHRLLRNGVLVFENDRVTFVGRTFAGPVDRRIDATGKLVIPGFVNIHCHADTEAGGRLIADVGRRDYFHTGFLNYYGARKGAKSLGPRQDPEIGGRFAMAEMLRNGCTTVVDIGVAAESHARIAGELGLRAYLSPAYKSAEYVVDGSGRLSYEENEAEGMAGLERAKQFIRKRAGDYDGRLQGMLFPYQVDTCSPALLRATRKAADELGVGIEIHAGQNLLEFHEILRRHTMTPVEYLADTGLLGPDAIVGHCIISTAHHLAGLPAGRDLEILAQTGASVATARSSSPGAATRWSRSRSTGGPASTWGSAPTPIRAISSARCAGRRISARSSSATSPSPPPRTSSRRSRSAVPARSAATTSAGWRRGRRRTSC